MHSTNYKDTFILIAEDCSAESGVTPPYRGKGKTVANLEYELISRHPYRYTSDDVRFAVYAERNSIEQTNAKTAREEYFSKGQPCFRASPLSKTYGWGVHSNSEGKIAIYGVDSSEYDKYANDKLVEKVSAMRSKRKK